MRQVSPARGQIDRLKRCTTSVILIRVHPVLRAYSQTIGTSQCPANVVHAVPPAVDVAGKRAKITQPHSPLALDSLAQCLMFIPSGFLVSISTRDFGTDSPTSLKNIFTQPQATLIAIP